LTYDALTKQLVGNCTQCHLLPDYSAGGGLASSDWRARQELVASRYTKFNHGPHLKLPATADCKHCHQSDRSELIRLPGLLKMISGGSDYQRVNSGVQQYFQHEFVNMQKSQCNACHQAGGASEGCTQCHNYHVGSDGLRAMLPHVQNADK
jgi:hypothetical protein